MKKVKEVRAFPMLSVKQMVIDFWLDELEELSRRRGRIEQNWRLILGADAGAVKSYIVWMLVGRCLPTDGYDTFIVLNQLAMRRAPYPLQADLLANFHEGTGYPKAVGLFTGDNSIVADTLLAQEIDKKERRSRLFLPSRQAPDGLRCGRCPKESIGKGWERIRALIPARDSGYPALMFCTSSHPTFQALYDQKQSPDEHHAVAAVRYALLGWEKFRTSLQEMAACTACGRC